MASLLERVIEVLKQQPGLEDANLTADTTLDEVGLDSLGTVEALMACEDEFGVDIDPDSNPDTVGDFVAIIEKAVV